MTSIRTLLFAFGFASVVAAADPIPVKVTTDTSAASTRVVLTFAKRVSCAVAEDAGRVKVSCEAAIAADPTTGTLPRAIARSS
jgi:hypothetical protein